MQKTVLCIIDGLGMGNIIPNHMPNLDRAMREFPSTQLITSGHEVGLPNPDDAGNSEVGHNAIGAGRRIKQGLSLLNDMFDNNSILETDTWKLLTENAKQPNRKLNIITLLSDGRVHSDIAHLHRVLAQAELESIPVAIHALADGRDVATQSVLSYIGDLKISTLAGRAVSLMDRYESNIPAMQTGFDLIVNGIGENGLTVKGEYKKNPTMTDEMLPPMIINKDGLIQNGDSVLLLNYRGDRAIQTCQMFETGKYLTAEQFAQIDKCVFAGALQYDAELGVPKNYLCPPPKIENTLTEWLGQHGVRQLSVAETVKFGHLTYFFNGNKTQPIYPELEMWIEIPSHEVNGAFNQVPQMRAREITEAVTAHIQNFDFIKLNLSNPDMVGHTADYDAVIKACQVVDECIGKLIEKCRATDINLIITSDHGNAEEMFYPDGRPKSSHTSNPVPFVFVHRNGHEHILRDGLGLTNIAATICDLFGLPIPSHFNPSILAK